jgi:hypothetical protein
MAVVGLRGTGDWGVDERPKNFRETILWRNPNGKAPLTALSAKMRKDSTDDAEFAWWEEELKPLRVQMSAVALTTGDTTVTILSASGDAQELVAGDVLMVEETENVTFDNEFVTVVSVTSTTVFVVSRATAGTTAGTIAASSFLTRIGNAFAEGTGAPASATRNPTKFKNFTQIFKAAYELTGTAQNTRTRTGDPMKNDKKRKMFDLSVMMEYAWFFGKPFETTGTNGKPLRYTGGLMHFLAQAVAAGATHSIKIWTTTPTEDQFLDAIYKMWDFDTDNGSSMERLGFCGNGFLNSLNKLARTSASTRVNFDGTVKAYGMELMRWILPQGVVYLKSHPLLNVHGRFTNSAFFINPSGIVYRPMRGRDVASDEGPGGRGIQANDADSHKGQWKGECGIEFNHLKTMSYQGNFIV